MWRTPCGERVLKGAAGALVRAALREILTSLELEAEQGFGPWESGLELYDALTLEQRVGILAEVTRGLFEREFPAPRLTAVHEAAIGAVFAMAEQRVWLELEEERDRALLLEQVEEDVTLWRRRVQACFAEHGSPELCAVSCTDPSEWSRRIECLAENIVWNDDWEAAELFLDADPEAARFQKEQWGIDEDYYAAAAPEPRGQALADAWDRMYALLE